LISLLPITKFQGGYIFYICEPLFLAKANKIREMTLIIGMMLRLVQVDSVCSTLFYAITSILHRYILPPSAEYTRKHYIILKVFFEARLPKYPSLDFSSY
jgi:hypothetical protein